MVLLHFWVKPVLEGLHPVENIILDKFNFTPTMTLYMQNLSLPCTGEFEEPKEEKGGKICCPQSTTYI